MFAVKYLANNFSRKFNCVHLFVGLQLYKVGDEKIKLDRFLIEFHVYIAINI